MKSTTYRRIYRIIGLILVLFAVYIFLVTVLFNRHIKLATRGTIQNPNNMIWIAGDEFTMDSENRLANANEKPAHRVKVNGFWMDQTDVTNAQFAKFVAATGYVTTAERKPDWPSSDIIGKENQPVIQVSYEDALAYAKWIGKRLPTKAEWEFAARNGLEQATFNWVCDAQSCMSYKSSTRRVVDPYHTLSHIRLVMDANMAKQYMENQVDRSLSVPDISLKLN